MNYTTRHLLLPPLVGAALLLNASEPLAAKDTRQDASVSPQANANANGLRKRVERLETDIGELQALNLPMDQQ
jgi:hypothetical protein